MNKENQMNLFLLIAGLVLTVVATAYMRSAYVSECAKGGHTERWCEMEARASARRRACPSSSASVA